jgi:hypothetical protein
MSFLSMRVVIDHHQVGTKNCSGGGGSNFSFRLAVQSDFDYVSTLSRLFVLFRVTRKG